MKTQYSGLVTPEGLIVSRKLILLTAITISGAANCFEEAATALFAPRQEQIALDAVELLQKKLAELSKGLQRLARHPYAASLKAESTFFDKLSIALQNVTTKCGYQTLERPLWDETAGLARQIDDLLILINAAITRPDQGLPKALSELSQIAPASSETVNKLLNLADEEPIEFASYLSLTPQPQHSISNARKPGGNSPEKEAEEMVIEVLYCKETSPKPLVKKNKWHDCLVQ